MAYDDAARRAQCKGACGIMARRSRIDKYPNLIRDVRADGKRIIRLCAFLVPVCIRGDARNGMARPSISQHDLINVMAVRRSVRYGSGEQQIPYAVFLKNADGQGLAVAACKAYVCIILPKRSRLSIPTRVGNKACRRDGFSKQRNRPRHRVGGHHRDEQQERHQPSAVPPCAMIRHRYPSNPICLCLTLSADGAEPTPVARAPRQRSMPRRSPTLQARRHPRGRATQCSGYPPSG